MRFIDRTGEINYNTFGSKMEVIKCNGAKDIDIYFEEYDYIARNKQYNKFKNGTIKCPYETRTFNKGYIGEGKYSTKKDGKETREYRIWHDMLRRCYDEDYHKRQPTYKDCEVCKEWLCFQNFAKWYEENYYEINGEKMQLDKDILHKGNKIYSPETCIFVPARINSLFTKRNASRGKNPIGVYWSSHFQKYVSSINCEGVQITLGYFNNVEEAFKIYKLEKEKEIKRIADKYKFYIPNNLYKAMYEYKVEISD